MRFATYAEVVDPDRPFRTPLPGGIGTGPGFLLREVLAGTGGRYEVRISLPDRARADVRRLVEVTGDVRLPALAEAHEVPVSLEHLRGHDPDATRIVYGCRIDRELRDPPVPGLDR